MYISVVGPGTMDGLVPDNDKIEVIHHSTDPEAHEFPTLELIRKTCKENECYVCYYHLRGVTSPEDNIPVVDQRHYMTYFNVERYDLCLKYLELGFDAVGVDLSTWPTTHFSGNFWWAKSEHINSLVNMEDLPEIPNFYPASDRKHRHRCEMWICSNPNSKYIEIWNSGIHPSSKGYVRYLPETYRGKA
jgi:hypothetical protein